jgi:Pyruvate/2-oxoacid:ferredoxin oxidoreductase gamma subunit
MVANVVMLGFLVAVTGLVTPQAMEEAIRTSVRERFVSLNLKAFHRGLAYPREGVVA